jgi:cytochrome c-type biogenesis protein CcmH
VTVRGRRIERSDALLVLAVAVVVLTIAVAAVTSRVGSLDDRARVIEAQLRCPTCQGLSIADSPATSAAQMRTLVNEQLAAGSSDDEVRAFFVARYGRWILLDPPMGGPDVALWLTPAAIVAIGAAFVVRRARAPSPSGAAREWSTPPPGPASRLPAILVSGAMVLALAVPIAVAVGPRLTGTEVSGGLVPQAAPAIEELEAFVRAEPRDVEALVALGDALHAANQVSEAANRYKAALELDPKNVEALLGVGAILLDADRPDAAGQVFDRILALSPDQPDALLYRAVARLRLDGSVSDDVRGDVRRFLEVAPQDDPRRPMAASMLEPSATSAPGRSAPAPPATPAP